MNDSLIVLHSKSLEKIGNAIRSNQLRNTFFYIFLINNWIQLIN